ncbi:Bug family tripartite tricarboxylate transporter substrate binding protein [Ottowia sp. VDI28]|uniref:Bug family tripartite tricarboxylate transporter substrate binding protein n=1 Tax=Ottowia sp. VDI28 TaxID=3133968 RepID=UPI003C2E7BCC
MQITQKLDRRAFVLAMAAAATPLPVWAAFPDKPLRMVVPFPAGGAADVMARGLALHMGEHLGQQVVIDNRGGAGGTMAAEMVARAPADGYTVFFATMGTHAINPSLYPKLRYDPVKDFTPIALTHITPRVLVVGPSIKARSAAEFIALAKSKPGLITYGSAGNGSSSHLSGALFATMAGVDLQHVPYKGSAPLLTDLLAGRVDATFDSYTVYEEFIRTGRVHALGVTSIKRMAALPQVPTLDEAGLKGYEVSNWLGLLAPAGTPGEVVARLNAAVVAAMADAGLKKQLTALGIEPVATTPEEFSKLIRSDIPKWERIVKASGARVE